MRLAPALLAALLAVACTSPSGAPGPRGEQGPQGPAGAQGPPGRDTTSTVATEAFEASDGCPDGGVRLYVGNDADGDGTLSEAERRPAATRELCRGATGLAGSDGAPGVAGPQGAAGVAALLRTTSLETSTLECPLGGLRVETGLDANGDGTLDAAEIDTTQTRELCHGAPGATGPAGRDGVDGARGADGADGAPGAPGAAGPQGPAGAQGPAAVKPGEEPTPAVRGELVVEWDRLPAVTLPLRAFRIQTDVEVILSATGPSAGAAEPAALEVEASLDSTLIKVLPTLHRGGSARLVAVHWPDETGATATLLSSTYAVVERLEVVPPRVAGQSATLRLRFVLGQLRVSWAGAAFDWDYTSRRTTLPACTLAPALPTFVTGLGRAPEGNEHPAHFWTNASSAAVSLGGAGQPPSTGKAVAAPFTIETTPFATSACAFSRMTTGATVQTTVLRTLGTGGLGPLGQLAEVELRSPSLIRSWRLSTDETGALRQGLDLVPGVVAWRSWSPGQTPARLEEFVWSYVENRQR